MPKPVVSRLVIFTIAMIFLSLAVTMLFPACTAAATRNVPGNYSLIQFAIDAADPGDTVAVGSGTYAENVIVYKNITLSGRDTGAGMPVIDGKPGTAVTITADGATLEGFSVTGAVGEGNAGIKVTASNAIIKNNTVTSNYYGIRLEGKGCVLEGNTVSYNAGAAIYVNRGSDNVLTRNIVSNNSGKGIFTYAGSNNVFAMNTANNNRDDGISVHQDNGDTITGNIFDNNLAGIMLWGCYGGMLTGNTVNSNTDYGICFMLSKNNRLTGNTINNNGQYGISIKDSFDNEFSLNHISNSNNVFVTSTGTSARNIWNSAGKLQYTYNGNTYASYVGNYWSDRTGPDANGDDIADTPYTIATDNTDNYPMINALPLRVDFTANATAGNAPLGVSFAGNSSISPVTWQWNFGDDTANATGQNLTHTYTTAGTYTVTVTVSFADGSNTTQKTGYITVTAAATASPAGASSTPASPMPLWISLVALDTIVAIARAGRKA